MTHAGHKKIVCTCGVIVSQCRCPDKNKPTEVIEMGCGRCRAAFSGAIPSEPIALDAVTDVQVVVAPEHEITINVTPLIVPDASPPLAAWQVSVETAKTEWRETFGSRDALDAFIRGVRVGAAMRGCFDVEVAQ